MSLKNENLISTRFVEDLIYSFNGSAHLKDLKSGKYIFSNEINAVNVGMYQAADLYGLTVRDLDRQMQQNWGDLATRIESFENQLRHQYKIILDDRQLSILPSGDLAIHNMKKYPILNSKNKIMAIVTLSELVTHQFDIFQQLEFYLTFYQSQGKKNCHSEVFKLSTNCSLFYGITDTGRIKNSVTQIKKIYSKSHCRTAVYFTTHR